MINSQCSIVMPILTREVTLHLDPGLTTNASLDLSNLGFLLGTFPSAPGILFYAMQYNVAVDMVTLQNYTKQDDQDNKIIFTTSRLQQPW